MSKGKWYPTNNIVCGSGNNQGSFTLAGNCGSDQWCLGPDQPSDAVCWNFKSKLCQKSKIK